jgi:hypothetical protein
MRRYISLLLLIGLAWGQDTLITDKGVIYSGKIINSNSNYVESLPKDWKYSTKLSNDKVKQLIDNRGQIIIDEDEKNIPNSVVVGRKNDDASSNAQNIKGLIIVGGLNQSNQYAEEELNDFDINYIDGYNLGIEKSFGNTRFGVGLNQRGVKLKSESNIMDISISVNGEQRVNYLTLHTVYPYMIQEKVTVFGGVQFGKGLGGEAKVKSLMSGSLLGEDYDHGFEQTEEIDADDMSLEYGLFIGVDYIINEFIGVRASYFKGLSDISEYAKIKNNTISVSLLFIPILGF